MQEITVECSSEQEWEHDVFIITESGNFAIATSLFLCLHMRVILITSLFVIFISQYLPVFTIRGHVKILRNIVANIPEPKLVLYDEDIEGDLSFNMYDAEENLAVARILREIVQYHNFILNFTGQISNYFGRIVGLNNLTLLLFLSVQLLEFAIVSIHF